MRSGVHDPLGGVVSSGGVVAQAQCATLFGRLVQHGDEAFPLIDLYRDRRAVDRCAVHRFNLCQCPHDDIAVGQPRHIGERLQRHDQRQRLLGVEAHGPVEIRVEGDRDVATVELVKVHVDQFARTVARHTAHRQQRDVLLKLLR